MNIASFVRKYNGKILEDAGAVKSNEFICFARNMKSTMRDICKNEGAELINFNIGHYYVSGFISKNGKYVYFNYDEPRHMPIHLDASDCSFGILIRKAKNDKDFHGESNHFCNIYQFAEMLNRLTA